MSKVYFSQPRNAYDEEQAYQRHLAYLKTQSNVSQQFQDAYRNEILGVPPTVPPLPTASEVLENQLELDKAVQKYLRMLVPDAIRPPAFDPTKEDMRIFIKRTQPAKYIYDNLTQPQKVLLVQNFPAIQTELKNYQFIDADFLLEYLDKYGEAFESTGGVSRLNRANLAIDEIKAVLDTVVNKDDIRQLISDIQYGLATSRDSIKGTVRRNIDRVMAKLGELEGNLPTADELNSLFEASIQLGQ